MKFGGDHLKCQKPNNFYQKDKTFINGFLF